MKLICSALFIAAILRVGFGQTTTFAPKSQCGIAALKCYTDQKSLMDNKINAFDLASFCQIFGTVLVCMENLGECSNDVDYLAVRQGCIEDQDGICGVDGSLQDCGVDVQVCFNDLKTIFNDASAKNFTAACPVINKFAQCAQNVGKTKECSPVFQTKLGQMQQALNSDKDIGGCDGPCAQAIGLCTLNATDLPTGQASLNLNFTTYCQSALQVETCLNNLQQNTVCASASSPNGIDPSSYLQAVIQNEFAKIGDVCNADGTPSACVTDLAECATDLFGLLASNSTDNRCQVASQFLECISKLPCMTSLASIVDAFRNELETAEIESQCPSVGSCTERFTKCSLPDEQLKNITQSNKDTACTAIKKSVGCFDFVKNDPYCINEKNAFATDETLLEGLINTQCGGAGGTFPTSAGSPCTQAIERCKTIPSLPTGQSIIDWDTTAYCQTALGVYACFNNLTQTSICSGSASGLSQSEYLQSERDNVFSKVQDVCNEDGSLSVCVSDLAMCSDDLTGHNVSDVNIRCQAMSSFLECSSSLPCGATLSSLIENYIKKLESEETRSQCPSVGSCKDRFILCGQQEQALVNSTQSNNYAACNKLRSCFDFVKNDPQCINEKQTFANEERDAESFVSGVCGGGAQIFLQLKLIVVSLMLCLKQYL